MLVVELHLQAGKRWLWSVLLLQENHGVVVEESVPPPE